MKKLTILLALAMMCSLCACAPKQEAPSVVVKLPVTTEAPTEVPNTAAANTEQTEASATEPVELPDETVAVLVDGQPSFITTAPVEYSFFDAAIFVGDSLTNQLGAYVGRVRNTEPDYMGTARFGGVGFYGICNALKPVEGDNPHHVYKGETMNSADYVATRGAESTVDRVYVMMGMNDLNLYHTTDDVIAAYRQYIGTITAKNPDVEIVVMTLTPVGQVFIGNGSGKLNPAYIDEFNVKIEQMCDADGYGFINTNAALRDDAGMLPDNLASADGFHLTDEGYGKLIDTICAQASICMQ